MTRQQATRTTREIRKALGDLCSVIRIGTGKNVVLGLHGPLADTVADKLCENGFHRTPLSGDGSRLNPITIDSNTL